MFLLLKKEEFWLIALSNGIYLIMAKVLTNKLRGVIDGVVSQVQTTFVPGRNILDGYVAAIEILSLWRSQRRTTFLWKVDFRKVYDSVHWSFLWASMIKKGFPPVWIRWMKQCATTTSFFILINRNPTGGSIQQRRGV
jgi:hypothetical protein